MGIMGVGERNIYVTVMFHAGGGLISARNALSGENTTISTLNKCRRDEGRMGA